MRVALLAVLLVLALGAGAAAQPPSPDGEVAAGEAGDSHVGRFVPAGSLAEPRYSHTATLLPDGRVLVVGGHYFPESLASAEVWDPTTGTFEPVGELAEGRGSHTATLLDDGRVLVVGGTAIESLLQDDDPVAAETWDPDTSAFSPAGSLTQARSNHTANLLADGRVLIIGGFGCAGEDLAIGDISVCGEYFASAEFWDPETDTFSPGGSLLVARGMHTATRLPDGRVLIIGGDGPDAEYVALAEVWDPGTEAFSPAGTLAVPRGDHTATLLEDGRVLVVGGWSGDMWDLDEWDHTASVEIWDPTTAEFSPTGSLTEKRAYHTANLLPDGRVLVIGGGGDWGPRPSAEVWDPDTDTFTPAGSLAVARGMHTATLLPDGRVLVVGGSVEVEGEREAEIWEPGG